MLTSLVNYMPNMTIWLSKEGAQRIGVSKSNVSKKFVMITGFGTVFSQKKVNYFLIFCHFYILFVDVR